MTHNPDCDVNDQNPDGIKKPCNCGLDSLTAQLEEARKDKERLDWLERKHYSYQRSSTGRYAFSILQFIPDGHNAMRDAIDAAMTNQKEEK